MNSIKCSSLWDLEQKKNHESIADFIIFTSSRRKVACHSDRVHEKNRSIFIRRDIMETRLWNLQWLWSHKLINIACGQCFVLCLNVSDIDSRVRAMSVVLIYSCVIDVLLFDVLSWWIHLFRVYWFITEIVWSCKCVLLNECIFVKIYEKQTGVVRCKFWHEEMIGENILFMMVDEMIVR